MEIYFSIIQRKVLSPNNFTDLDAVERRLTDFQERYNTTARPFQWKFTTTDLADFLERLEQRQQTDTTTPAQSRAA